MAQEDCMTTKEEKREGKGKVEEEGKQVSPLPASPFHLLCYKEPREQGSIRKVQLFRTRRKEDWLGDPGKITVDSSRLFANYWHGILPRQNFV